MNAQKAPVTKLLLLANVLVFFITRLAFGDQLNSVFYSYGLVPNEFWAGQGWWMPITSIFLHANFLHILFNMVALWSLGTPMEMTLGSQRFAWLYGVSGMGGAIAVLLWHFVDPMTAPTVGASGAIFGLLGALAIFYPNSLMLFFFIPMKARTVVILVLVISIVLMLTDSLSILSHAGHLGGLGAGLLYSRFALGLPLIGNVLHQAPKSGPYFSGGSAGATGSARSGSSEEQAREALGRFFGNATGNGPDVTRDTDPGIFTGNKAPEKVINPDPGTWNAPGVEPKTEPTRPASEPPRPAAEPTRPVSEPARPAADSSQPSAEPMRPAADQARASNPESAPTPESASSSAAASPPEPGPETSAPPPSGGKRLHFDQETGRFYFK